MNGSLGARVPLDPPCQVRAGHVDVWATRLDTVSVSDLRALAALLPPSELRRATDAGSPSHGNSQIVTRSLVRTVLSKYTDVAPRQWEFVRTEFGKPMITSPRCHRELAFSVSHSGDLVVCAVGLDGDLGVDVERVNRAIHVDALAQDCLSGVELQELLGHHGRDRQRRFLEYWTLKEAYAKARGEGLRMAFDSVAFDLSHGDNPRLASGDLQRTRGDKLFLGRLVGHSLAIVYFPRSPWPQATTIPSPWRPRIFLGAPLAGWQPWSSATDSWQAQAMGR